MSSVWVKNFWGKKNESFLPQNVFPPLYKFFTPKERPIKHFEVGMRDQKSSKSDLNQTSIRLIGRVVFIPELRESTKKRSKIDFSNLWGVSKCTRIGSVWVKNFWGKKNESFLPQNVFPPLYKFLTPKERPINHFEVGNRDQKSRKAIKSDCCQTVRASGFYFAATVL